MVIMVPVVATALPARAEARISISFARAQIGALPPGFAIERTCEGVPADWKIVEDDKATDGRALAQTSVGRTDYRFPLAIYHPVSAANVEGSVRFTAIADRIDPGGGIAVRLTDPDNYYVLRANTLEDNVNLYRVIKGSRGQIQDIRHKVSHSLGLKAVAIVSRYRSTARNFFMRAISRSPNLARSQSGPRSIASPALPRLRHRLDGGSQSGGSYVQNWNHSFARTAVGSIRGSRSKLGIKMSSFLSIRQPPRISSRPPSMQKPAR
jgi:hypothetical protein